MRINTPQISHQTIDGEVVVINLENGCYYGLRDLAAAIWQQVDGGASRAAIVDAAARSYPDTADAGSLAAEFIEQLITDRLVVATQPDAHGDGAIVTVDFPAAFSPPILEKFSDLQDLLLLDPIHDVDETGWPHKPSDS